MNIAIYSRKSKLTHKGESIENQIQLCNDYINVHYPTANISIYEDEGFSGGTTDRPQFKQLLLDAKAKKFDILICYRLDRVSRNIADFATLIERLQNDGIGFISIKEQFDTTTPMGRAMMYISGVFAQLERETIAERVKDNMLQLSKTGRWLGGIPPTGFVSEEITNESGKKLYKLIPVEEEITLVQIIFNNFLEFKSLTKLETFLIQNDIKTKNGKNYCIAAIKLILNNPVYAPADQLCYDYLFQKGCIMSYDKDSFTGEKALIAYNRTNQSKNARMKKNDYSEWIISIGEHKPVIGSLNWIEAQSILDRNKDRKFRKVRSQEALLSGILKCEQCGSYMRPKQSRMSADGKKVHYYYICELKEKSNGLKCNVKNVPGHTLDEEIVSEISSYSTSNSKLLSKISTDIVSKNSIHTHIVNNIDNLKKEIESYEAQINNLLTTLSQAPSETVTKYILSQVDDLGKKVADKQQKLEQLSAEQVSSTVGTLNLELMLDTLTHFQSSFSTASIEMKRELIRSIIETITWDGEHIKVNVFGGNSLKKQ